LGHEGHSLMTTVDPFSTDDAPLTEPEAIIIGDFEHWKRVLNISDLSYRIDYDIRPVAGGAAVTITGTTDDDGETWYFSTAGVTFVAGPSRWEMYAVRLSDSERRLQYSGTVEVYASTDDRRSHAEVMVAKINSVLEGRADSDVDSYSIKSRSITKMSVSELRQWRDYYISEIERTGGSLNTGNSAPTDKIRVRFVK
jgi:hypothetical protein